MHLLIFIFYLFITELNYIVYIFKWYCIETLNTKDPIQIISNLEAKFNKIIVPENELPTISSNELKEKKSELEILKEQLLTFEKDNKFSNINSDNAVNTSFIFTKTENIIEKIILEIKLYEHFINKSGI